MSKSMFANPKSALGFAGVVIIVAVVASFGAGAFLPTPREDSSNQEATVVELDAPQTAQAAPSQTPPPAWGNGNLSDSWASTASPTSGPAQNQSGSDEFGKPDQDFGDYQPTRSSSASRSNRTSNNRGSSPQVTSRAAPGAPPLPGASQPAPSLVNQ